jgi:toxin-antitoxin system PIN domain toxin
VKIVDLNILLYAVNRSAVHHEPIRAWWEAALSADEPVGLPWIVILGFLRLSTKAGIFPRPLSPDQALARIERWLALPVTRVVTEDESHWHHLRALVSQLGTAGNLTTDAHLAALAISRGATLISCDTDFGRFPRLAFENPLAT